MPTPSITPLPAELTFRRARVTRFRDGALVQVHRRTRFVLAEGKALLLTPAGTAEVTAVVDEGVKDGTRTVRLVTADGEQWEVVRADCGCGGGG